MAMTAIEEVEDVPGQASLRFGALSEIRGGACMSDPRTDVDQAIRQRPLLSWSMAWEAVHDETPLGEYLTYRFRVYETKGRRSFHPLKFDIAIMNGQIVLTPNPEYEPYWEQLRDDSVAGRGAQFVSAIEAQGIHHEEEQIEAQSQALQALQRDLDERIEQKGNDEVNAISEGKEPSKSTRARLASQRGKQPLPFPWLPLSGYLAIAFLLLVEVFQLTWPFLDLLGIDATNISYEYQRSPVAVAVGVTLAISTTAILMLLWHEVMKSAVELATSWETAGPLRSGGKLVWVVILFVGLLIFTLAVAFLRHSTTGDVSGFQDATPGEHAGSHTGTIVFVCLTFLTPAAAAYLQKKIAESSYWQLRADMQAQHARRDKAVEDHLRPGNIRGDVMEILQTERARLAQEQARLDARRKAIADRVVAAQKAWEKKLDDEQAAGETYRRTLVSALAMDRYYYLRFARRYKAHLVPQEASCLPQGSTSASVTENHGASSGDEPIPHYRIARPFLTGPKHVDES
jgi:hypothetical protein